MKKILILAILLLTFGSINAQCKVYSGTGYSAKQIGYFEAGKIYSGTGYSAKQVGYFEAGKIYSGTGYSAKQVGSIESGGGGCSAAASFLLLL